MAEDAVHLVHLGEAAPPPVLVRCFIIGIIILVIVVQLEVVVILLLVNERLEPLLLHPALTSKSLVEERGGRGRAVGVAAALLHVIVSVKT